MASVNKTRALFHKEKPRLFFEKFDVAIIFKEGSVPRSSIESKQ